MQGLDMHGLDMHGAPAQDTQYNDNSGDRHRRNSGST